MPKTRAPYPAEFREEMVQRAEGVGFEPTRRSNPLRHFECRALGQTMRPLRRGLDCTRRPTYVPNPALPDPAPPDARCLRRRHPGTATVAVRRSRRS